MLAIYGINMAYDISGMLAVEEIIKSSLKVKFRKFQTIRCFSGTLEKLSFSERVERNEV